MTEDVLTFQECDACVVKPGSPILCAGCLRNRAVIGELLDQLHGKTKSPRCTCRITADRGVPFYPDFDCPEHGR